MTGEMRREGAAAPSLSPQRTACAAVLPPGLGPSEPLEAWERCLAGQVTRRRKRRATPRLLVVDRYVPTHTRDSGSLRMFRLLSYLAGHGFSVSFLPADGGRDVPEAVDLERAGIEILAEGSQGGEAVFRRGPLPRADIVLCSRPEPTLRFLPWLRAHAGGTPIVYDTTDLHYLRFERQAAVLRDVESVRQARILKASELLCAAEADVVLTVTEEDGAALLRDLPGARVEVVPNVHRPAAHVAAFEGRRDLLFVGGFYHQPNVDALEWCMREILPRVRQELPGTALRVVGADMPEAILGIARSGVRILGHVPDLAEEYACARVFVAPLRFGAGLKGKIGESLAAGIPVVTTAIGAEGFRLVDGRDALVADTPEEFAAAVVRVATDAELWGRLSASGRALVAARLTPEIVGAALVRVLESLLPEDRA